MDAIALLLSRLQFAFRLPRGDRRRRYGARPSAAVRHLQRPERMGEAPRGAAPAQTDLSQLVPGEPGSEASEKPL
jgi:hypothetical protein